MNSKKDSDIDNKDFFQELYELILEEADEKKGGRKKSHLEKYETQTDSTDFLECEQARMNKLNSLFGLKLENLKKNSQTNELIARQQFHLQTTKEDLILKFSNEKSILQKQLAYLWDKTFG